MPRTSALKHSAAHFWRRPGLPGGRAWLWACVAAWVSVGVGAVPQQFPEASEDNHFIFRSDGTYSFSYDTGGGQHQSFRIERRDSAGRVSGRFGYVDPDGVLRITEYQADTEGYRANMEIYHLVSWLPSSPLIVGPLPQPPSEAEDQPDLHEAPKQTTNGRIGTPLFFPPEGPVLIIGPLPKPLQPSRDLMNQEPPNLSQEELLGASLSTVLPPPPLDFLQGPATQQDLLQSSPPQILQEGILNALLQGSLEEILQKSIAELLSTSALNTTQGISNNTLQDTNLLSESSQSTDGQDLLEGMEQMNLRSDIKESSPTSQTISLPPDEDRNSPSNNVDNTATIVSNESVSKTTVFDSLQQLPEPSTNNSFLKRQDNSHISDASATGTASSTTTSTTISTTNSTTTSFTTSTATITLSRVNSEARTRTQVTMSASPQLTTKASPQPTTLARPRLTITTASEPATSTRTLQPTTTKRTPGLTTTKESTSTFTATVTWSLSPTSSSGAGVPRSGQESERYHSATFPPVPALTYLPVAEDTYDTPLDTYSHLPQTFNPFFSV